MPPGPKPAVQGVGAIKESATKWVQRYQGFVSGAAKVSKWINVGCGAWLVVSTPVSAVSSAITLRPADVVLSLYLGMFGAMMAGIELPIGPLKRIFELYFRFMYTTHGRMGFMVLVACIAWSCRHVGLLSKAFVLFDAGLSVYVYNSPVRGRYADEDNTVREGMTEAADELRKTATDALSFANMFGFGRALRGSGGSSSRPARPPPRPAESPYSGVGAEQPAASPYADAGRSPPYSAQPAWPSEDS